MRSAATVMKTLLAVAIFVGGCGVLLYPAVSGFVNERSQTKVIADYEETAAALQDEDRTRSHEAAQAYNQALTQAQNEIVDPFGDATSEAPPQEISFISVGDMLGYLHIPAIGIRVPIYDNTSEEALQKGIGWLRGTSLPVGGISTNSVLTGHRGLPTAKLFTELDRLDYGDEFFVKNTTEILAYRVSEITIIEPEDSDALVVVKGADRMTLLTCHPYMINNQRLLIIGDRIPYAGQLDDTAREQGLIESLTPGERDLGLAIVIAVVFVVFALLMFVKPWRKRKKSEKEG